MQELTGVYGSPANQLLDLRKLIAWGVANGSIEGELLTPLLLKVDAATAALARGDPNDARAAMNDLKALINQVQAQRDKKIGTATADEIGSRANSIVADLGG